MGHKVKNKNFKITPIKLEMHFYETYEIPLDIFEKFWFQVAPYGGIDLPIHT